MPCGTYLFHTFSTRFPPPPQKKKSLPPGILMVAPLLSSFICVAPWGWPSRGGAVLYRLSPQLGEDPPVEDLGLCDPLGEPGWLSW